MFSLDSTDTELHFSEGNQNKYNVQERKIIADKVHSACESLHVAIRHREFLLPSQPSVISYHNIR